MIKDIFEFNEQVLNLSPRPLQPLTHTPNEYEFTVKAFQEEIGEFAEGWAKQDVVQMADSLLDLCYFAVGALKRMGLTADQAEACFGVIHTANMTKKKGALAKRGGFADDAVKPEGFVPPDVAIAHILMGPFDDGQGELDLNV